MSDYNVSPGTIHSDVLHAYRQNWEKVISDPNPEKVNSYFTSGDARMNYVFMEIDAIQTLIGHPNTTQVQTVFVAAPLDNPQFFSIVLVPLDDDGFPTSSNYYLAGVDSQPAKIGPPPLPTPLSTSSITPDVLVSNTRVYPWITSWNDFGPGRLSLELFQSGQDVPDHRTLRAYTYSKDDFTGALGEGPVPESLALWLNFALHSEEEPNGTASPTSFAMTLCLNRMPVNEAHQAYSGEIDFTSAQHYFDLSKPCPPYCSVFIAKPAARVKA